MATPRWRLLLVDDSTTYQSLIQRSTGKGENGAEITGAATLEEALARLRQGGFDAVVADLFLEDAGGLDVIRALRKHTRVPIIATTGEEIDPLDVLRAGADEFLHKTTNFHLGLGKLVETVYARLEGRGLQP